MNKAFSSKLGKPPKQIHGAIYSFEVLRNSGFLPGVYLSAHSGGSSYPHSALLVPRVLGLLLVFLFKPSCTTLLTLQRALPAKVLSFEFSLS